LGEQAHIGRQHVAAAAVDALLGCGPLRLVLGVFVFDLQHDRAQGKRIAAGTLEALADLVEQFAVARAQLRPVGQMDPLHDQILPSRIAGIVLEHGFPFLEALVAACAQTHGPQLRVLERNQQAARFEARREKRFLHSAI